MIAQPGSYQLAGRVSTDKRASLQCFISWRDADFPLLITVGERQITSAWPTIYPEPWSSFSRTPFMDSFRFGDDAPIGAELERQFHVWCFD